VFATQKTRGNDFSKPEADVVIGVPVE